MHPEEDPLKPETSFHEVAPRVFEVALHYSNAISAGVFGQVVEHDRAASMPVRPVAGRELPPHARDAFHGLAARSITTLNARARTATLPCRRAERDRLDTYAVLDAAVGREGWFVAARLTWPLYDFRDNECVRGLDHIVLAVENDHEDELELFRLTYDDVEGAALRAVTRDSLLQALVLRPGFGAGHPDLRVPRFSRSIPHSGDGDGEATA